MIDPARPDFVTAMTALYSEYHPASLSPADAEANVHADENEPGLGDGSPDPVADAENSDGLSLAPASLQPANAAANARKAMDLALLATRTSLAASADLLTKAMASADAAVAQALAASAPKSGV